MKKISIIFFSFMILLSLVGCTKKDNETCDGNTSDNNYHEGEEKELYSDDSKLVYESKQIKLVFYYDKNENITDYLVYNDFIYLEQASKAFDEYEKDENMEDVSLDGRYIVIKYKKEYFKDMKVEDVKDSYKNLTLVENN